MAVYPTENHRRPRFKIAPSYPPVGSSRPSRVDWVELERLLTSGFPHSRVLLLQNVPSAQAKRAKRPATIRQNLSKRPENYGVELLAIELPPRKDGRKSGWNLVAVRMDRERKPSPWKTGEEQVA